MTKSTWKEEVQGSLVYVLGFVSSRPTSKDRSPPGSAQELD
jgi:hypothetical protein